MRGPRINKTVARKERIFSPGCVSHASTRPLPEKKEFSRPGACPTHQHDIFPKERNLSTAWMRVSPRRHFQSPRINTTIAPKKTHFLFN
jgi:hypothetical protein